MEASAARRNSHQANIGPDIDDRTTALGVSL
jgi:hypothetical protein